MTAPPGAWQRAALVTVPLALVALIFVTPSLISRPGETQATDIPSLIVEVAGGTADDAWNKTVNASAVLYVRSALGLPLYESIEFDVSGMGPWVNVSDLAVSCGGAGAWNTTSRAWRCGSHRVPSVWQKLPAVDDRSVNVSALTVHGTTRFWYNATITFEWMPNAWMLRVTPEGEDQAFETVARFTTDMMRQENP